MLIKLFPGPIAARLDRDTQSQPGVLYRAGRGALECKGHVHPSLEEHVVRERVAVVRGRMDVPLRSGI